MTDISVLNGLTFNALDSSVDITLGNGLSYDASTGVYTASPNQYGNLSNFDKWQYNNWDDTPISQVPVGLGDITAIQTVIDTGSPADVFEYSITTGSGPLGGLVGGEVAGWNSTSVLVDILTGLVLGGNPQVVTTNEYFILSTADLSQSDGSTPNLTFSTTGAFPDLSLSAPAPVVTLAASPTASGTSPATLGTVAPIGSDRLSVTLNSDTDFATGSTLVLNNGTLVYTPGTVSVTNAGTDTLTYTVTDTATGAATSETQTVKLFALAQPNLSATSINLGSVRVGGTLAAGTITLSDGANASAYQESLVYAATGPSGLTLTGARGTIASGGSAALGFDLGAATAGTVNATASLSLTSAGTAGLANAALSGQTVAISASVYAAAKATLGTSKINAGIIHSGASVGETVGVTNAATGALTDLLTGGTAAVAGGVSGVTFNLGTGLASGAAGTAVLAINTGTAGTFSGSAVLGFTSHDGALSDIAVNGGTVTVTGTVDNYATAQIVQSGGSGTLTNSGTAYTLNLGSIAQGASAVVADLGVQNTAGGPADLLSGSFTVGGTTSFANSGLTAFSGLGAGARETAQVVKLNTGTAGVFSETITLYGTGSNASGYAGTLAAEVLTVTGTVVAGQTYTLTTTPVTITGSIANDTFDAAANTLLSGDSLDGGAGVNTLALLGGGTFDLRAPTKLANIQVVTAQETAGGTTVYMRSGINETVNVAPAGSGSLLIYGNTDSNVYKLGAGSDTVVLGAAGESVNGGGGTALVQASAGLAGAAVAGTSSGSTTLEITSGGTVSLNAADTHVTVKLDASTNLTLGSLGFITAVGSTTGGETITAGGSNQTLQSIAGNETLVGSSGFGDTFLGKAAGFAGDVIKNFGGSDLIDITDIAVATLKPLSFSAATDKLVLSDATHSATLTFTGSYTAASFSTASDGHGGTLVKWV
jgi:hypothetical protein